MQVKISKVSFSYAVKKVLKKISFEANGGDMVAIIGQNGSGKSTLLKCMAGILKVNKGSISLDGRQLSSFLPWQLSKILAYVPQQEERTSGLCVFDAVLLGRKPYIRVAPSLQDMENVARILRRLNLEQMAMQQLPTLSGGQRQRVFIARALAQNPEMLLLDEPIANLDLNHQIRVLSLLQELAKEGKTIVLTLHDVNLAARFCNRVLMLKEGEVFASGVDSVYTSENIERLYDVKVDILYHKNKICVIPY